MLLLEKITATSNSEYAMGKQNEEHVKQTDKPPLDLSQAICIRRVMPEDISRDTSWTAKLSRHFREIYIVLKGN